MEKTLPYLSQNAERIANKSSKTRTSPMQLLLTGITILFLCFLSNTAQLEAQFSFEESAFTIVKKNSYGDGWLEYEGQPTGGYPQYRLTRNFRMTAVWDANFMHHTQNLDLTKCFAFRAKVGFIYDDPYNPPGNYYGEGLTFLIHNHRPYDTLIRYGR